MKKHKLIAKIFKTPLGDVTCSLVSSNRQIARSGFSQYRNGNSESFETGGFSIELVEFKIGVPLYNGGSIVDSQGWIWRVEKTREMNTQLRFGCRLSKYSDAVEFDVASGENLDAIEASTSEWTLHIGTEDGDIMNSRAELDDWYPSRFYKVNFCQKITKLDLNGFDTELPILDVGERFHIQYVAAYELTTPDSVNTWLAVDGLKREFEELIGLHTPE